MPDILDFGSRGMKRFVAIFSLAFLSLYVLNVLPTSMTTGDIVGIKFLMIAGVLGLLSAYWIIRNLMTFA